MVFLMGKFSGETQVFTKKTKKKQDLYLLKSPSLYDNKNAIYFMQVKYRVSLLGRSHQQPKIFIFFPNRKNHPSKFSYLTLLGESSYLLMLFGKPCCARPKVILIIKYNKKITQRKINFKAAWIIKNITFDADASKQW